jgi:hypothetical protein
MGKGMKTYQRFTEDIDVRRDEMRQKRADQLSANRDADRERVASKRQEMDAERRAKREREIIKREVKRELGVEG